MQSFKLFRHKHFGRNDDSRFTLANKTTPENRKNYFMKVSVNNQTHLQPLLLGVGVSYIQNDGMPIIVVNRHFNSEYLQSGK